MRGKGYQYRMHSSTHSWPVNGLRTRKRKVIAENNGEAGERTRFKYHAGRVEPPGSIRPWLGRGACPRAFIRKCVHFMVTTKRFEEVAICRRQYCRCVTGWTWVTTIRDDVKFTDGEPLLTAADVAFTYNNCKEKVLQSMMRCWTGRFGAGMTRRGEFG